jgi:hypothetical protein
MWRRPDIAYKRQYRTSTKTSIFSLHTRTMQSNTKREKTLLRIWSRSMKLQQCSLNIFAGMFRKILGGDQSLLMQGRALSEIAIQSVINVARGRTFHRNFGFTVRQGFSKLK